MFKSKKMTAQDYLKEAELLEKMAEEELKRTDKNNEPCSTYYCELKTEAAGLRCMADDIENDE